MNKKISIKQLTYLITIVIIMFFPKINLISFSGTTTGIRIDDFMIFISIILYATSHKEKIRIKNNSIYKYFYIYIVICIISTLLGYLKEYISIILGIVYVLRKIEYFMLFIIGKDLLIDNVKLKKIINISVVYNLIIIILQQKQIIGSFSTTSFGTVMEGRYSSIFNGSYELTAFLLLLLPFYLINYEKKSISNYIYIFIIFVILYLSESRTSMLLFLIVVTTCFFKETRKTKNTYVILAIFIATIILYILLSNTTINILPRLADLNFNNMIEAIKYSWNQKSIYNYLHNPRILTYYSVGDISFNIRIKNWMCLIDGIIKNPVFGMGMSVVKNAADGGYIRMLSEVGVVGTLSWLICIISIYKYTNDNCRIERYIILSIILGSIFIDLFDASKVMCTFWLFTQLLSKEEFSK